MWILVLFITSYDGREITAQSIAKQEYKTRKECVKAGLMEKHHFPQVVHFVCEKD